MNDETVLYLLRGGHISMDERTKLGIWPHAPLRLGDLTRFLAAVLERERWFPCPYEPEPAGSGAGLLAWGPQSARGFGRLEGYSRPGGDR